MVAALLHHDTIFTVLGDAARQRRPRGLLAQLAICLAAGIALLLMAPRWWSVAALAGAVASHAAWGLAAAYLAPRTPGTTLQHVPPLIGGLGTALAAAGLLGLAAALFTGTGRSPYTPCGPGARSAYCRATTSPPPTTRVP
jgi:hypothetical protein